MKPTETRRVLASLAVMLVVVGSAGAQEEVSILGMAWTPTPAPALVVSASGPLSYREGMGEAGVWTVEFPAARLSQPVDSLAEPQAGLKRATLAANDAGAVSLILELAPGVHPLVRPLPAGVEVRLGGRERPPAARRGEVDVVPVVEGETVTVLVKGLGAVAGKAFTLDNPPRVAVDIPGVLPAKARRVYPVGQAGVQRVRVAQFAVQPEPVVRVAIDLDSPMKYVVETTPEGVAVRLGAGEGTVASSTLPLPEGVTPVAVREEAALPQPVKVVEEKASPVPPAAPAFVATSDVAMEPPVVVAQTPRAGTSAPKAVVDSPYTSTPKALVEQAAPTPIAAAGAKEVETQERQFTGEPISLELKDADIKDVLRSFAKITGLNIVVDPDVTGSVTVNLENVPWDQCLDIILRINRLDYVIENNVLRVARMERLTQEKQALAAYQKQAEAARPMKTVTKVLSYARAEDVKAILTAEKFIVSERGSVVVDPRSNMLIIRDLADRLEGILNLIDELDHPNPQVLIEARIVETRRSFGRALGVSWSFTGIADAERGTTTGWKFPNSGVVRGRVFQDERARVIGAPVGTLGFAFADILNAFNLDVLLSAAESYGLARVISSPKVIAQDNQAAKIESGLQVPIPQTVTQGNTTTTTVTFKDATIKLDVKPHITAEGTVLLTVNLEKTDVELGLQIPGSDQAPYSTRKTETSLLVRDGGTVVIGGVYRQKRDEQLSGVPGLSKLPVVGHLFKQTSTTDDNDELLIFITPRILKY